MSFQKRYEEMQLYKKPLKISESRSKYYEEIQSNKKKKKLKFIYQEYQQMYLNQSNLIPT